MVELIKKLLAALLGGGKIDAALTDAIKEHVIGAGGLGALVEKLKASGLEQVVASWIGTGKNLPVTPAQIQEALGSEKLQELAGKLGLSADAVKAKLAQILPKIIDQMTPNGKLPG